MSKFTLVLDSSQISTYSSCAMEWSKRYHASLIPVSLIEDQSAMNAGTYGHKILDIYYKLTAKGVLFNDATRVALAYDPDTDTCECGCSKDSHSVLEALSVNPCTRCNRCINFRAKPFDLDDKFRRKVLNRLREYFFKYQSNDFKPLSAEHVEVGFSEPIYEDAENLFVLEGRIDLIASLQGLKVIGDHKFQLARHYLYPKSIQAKNYCLVTKSTLFMYNYIRLTDKIDEASLQRIAVSFNVPELVAWKAKLIGIFFRIKDSVVRNDYNQNFDNCKGYGKTYDLDKAKFCPYATICEEPNEDMKVRKEKELFKVKEVKWKPW